jgi:predicted nicotinamide N-methyase
MNAPDTESESLQDPAGESSLQECLLEVGGREWVLLHGGILLTHADEAQFINDQKDDTAFGVALWPAAIALAHAVNVRAEAIRGARVLELGAGTGLPGLTAAALGAEVVQTDHHEPTLSICRRNGERNGIDTIEYRLVDWSEWRDEAQYDWILGSDILYNIEMHPHLQRIFESNLAPGGRVLLSDPFRNMGLDLLETLEVAGWTNKITKWQLGDDAAKRPFAIFELAPPAARRLTPHPAPP